MLIALFLIAVLLICIGIVLYGRQNYGTLENCGFPVVKPSLFLGSNPDLHKKVQHLLDIERFKKYGSIWGVYEGKMPQVYVCDPELIRLILVKDFEHFYDRREIDLGSPLFNEILDFLPGEKWKTVRNTVSPLFTTSKLRLMTDVIATTAEEYAQDLLAECKQNGNGRIKYDCKKRLSCWLIDMFAQSTLGISLNNAKDPDNEFAVAFRTLIGENIEYDWLYTLSMTFPILTRLAPAFDDQPTNLIASTFRHIMENRRLSGVKNNKDFVDYLNTIWEQQDSAEFKKLGITELTVIAQAVNFFLGGYETSSTTLSHLLHYLALNPEIQDCLYEEISSRFPDSSAVIDHETIKEENTPYLTACLNESLRLAPPLLRPERICTKDWEHNGIRIKKGTQVFIATWAGHRNPEYFPDPEQFQPERFLAENKGKIPPYAISVFGHGPRNCIGMRFAYESIKVFLIHLIRNFRVELRKDTVMKYKPGSTLLISFDPLYLDLVQR